MDLKRTRQISIFSDEIGWICFRERREALTSKWTYRAMWSASYCFPRRAIHVQKEIEVKRLPRVEKQTLALGDFFHAEGDPFPVGRNRAVVKREVRLDSWQAISHRHYKKKKKTRKQAIIQKNYKPKT